MTILQYILAAIAILIMLVAIVIVIAIVGSDLCFKFRNYDNDDEDNFDV